MSDIWNDDEEWANYQASLAADARRAEEHNTTWREKWPNHCQNCGGWGGMSYPSNWEEPPSFDPCEAIEDSHICHRCGEAGLSEDGAGPCSKCGWNYDDGLMVP